MQFNNNKDRESRVIRPGQLPSVKGNITVQSDRQVVKASRLGFPVLCAL